ncbi:MAG TPA: hypothetical protein VKP30_03370, partial [Polyangiaceae bacterium]|nr:hypothetical protein [Polyangiaceae bacterium]
MSRLQSSQDFSQLEEQSKRIQLNLIAQATQLQLPTLDACLANVTSVTERLSVGHLPGPSFRDRHD